MAKLTTKARKRIPSSEFGLPKERKLSGAAERSIDRKADAVIARLNKRKPAR